MKQIAILGSTGSIGTQTLDVVRQHSSQFSVYAISANRSVDLLIEQALEFNPAVVCIADEKYYSQYKDVCFPAWSLHRLMEIVMQGDKLGCITHNIHQNNVATYYELVIASIEHLIKIDEFNKDYIEERV
jgi:1-deoxy-D-xylulose 5-phosphate reductoisomerase